MGQIHLVRENLQVTSEDGAVLLEQIRGLMSVPADCGGKGTCGKCKIKVSGRLSPVTGVELRLLSGAELASGVRLACQARTLGDVKVYGIDGNIPSGGKTLLHQDGFLLRPGVQKLTISMPEPAPADHRSDWDRLSDALAEKGLELDNSLALAKTIPGLLRENRFTCSAICFNGTCKAVLKPDDTPPYGMAFDLGTTTVAGALYNLSTGIRIGAADCDNPQSVFGADVISRIEYATSTAGGLLRLQKAIVGALNGLVHKLCAQSGLESSHILDVVIVGNTAMQHFLCGIEPSGLGVLPFVPAGRRRSMSFSADEIGLEVSPFARVYLPPVIGGFIGSDLTAVILATRLYSLPEGIKALAIDLGTNGEIVLAGNKDITACSAAAGPAFEGAGLRFGMRGAPGAIQGVSMDCGHLALDVIGGGPPRGICGSGAVDLLAELLRHSLMDTTGRLVSPGESLEMELADRLINTPEGPGFLLADKKSHAIPEDIYFTQGDIRKLQMAKAAIAAGIRILLAEKGVSVEELQHIYLAGAFGNFIKPESAIRIGLLPQRARGKIVMAGNAAGAGAVQLLLDEGLRREMEDNLQYMRNIELASNKMFQDIFIEEMGFPAG